MLFLQVKPIGKIGGLQSLLVGILIMRIGIDLDSLFSTFNLI